jgi:hypothetical protein
MPRLKRWLNVPSGLESVHTAKVGNYFIEGHVPAEDIKLLLKEKPMARGLAVPGLPRGAPGREQSNPFCETACTILDNASKEREIRREAYNTLLVGPDGKTSVFARHATALARLDQMPDLIDGIDGTVVFTNLACEADADNITAFLFRHIDHVGVKRGHVRHLRLATALRERQFDFGEHLRCGEFADVIQISSIVGGLQADVMNLGVAHEAGDIEIRRNVCVTFRLAARTGTGQGSIGRAGSGIGSLGRLARVVKRVRSVAGTRAGQRGLLPGGALAQDETNDRDHCQGEQRHHHEGRQLFAKAEVRRQRGQSQTCCQACHRPHPGTATLGGSARGGSGRRCGSRGGDLPRCRRRVRSLGRRGHLALHSGRFAGTQALGRLGLTNAHGQPKGQGSSKYNKCLHDRLLCSSVTERKIATVEYKENQINLYRHFVYF